MAIMPWVRCLDVFYNGKEQLGLDQFKNVNAWVDRLMKRPKTAKGMEVLKV
jgi:GST-like protein